MPLFNAEKELFAHMLAMVSEHYNLAPKPAPKVTELKPCDECDALTSAKELTYDGNGSKLCSNCSEQLGNFDSVIYDEEVAPERLFDGDGEPSFYL